MEWQENALNFHTFVKDVSPMPPKFSFPDLHGSGLIETGISLFSSETHKWGMDSTMASECGAETAEHIITPCPIYHHSHGAHALSDANKKLATWLMETCPAI